MDFMGGSSDNCNATTHRYHLGFFQPLSPAFLNNFSIPRWYVKHMEEELKGRPLKSIVLVRQNAPQQHHWLVQIKDDGRHFKEESWKKYAVENDLTVGDFVVFIHAANFLFRVSVFDPVTASERRPLLQVHAHPKPSPKGLLPHLARFFPLVFFLFRIISGNFIRLQLLQAGEHPVLKCSSKLSLTMD